MPNGSIDWKLVKEADHHWNVDEMHAYPNSMVGQKLWPNPHIMVSDGSVCAYCVGTRNNNKRKESTRIREVCSSCQFFLAKQRYFYLGRRVSKFRTNPSNTKVN